MSTPDRILMESALRIYNSPEFKEYRAWIEKQQEEALKAIISANEDQQIYAARGAYKAVQQFKDLLKNAASVLDKMAR
jgi:hypothetical protein